MRIFPRLNMVNIFNFMSLPNSSCSNDLASSGNGALQHLNFWISSQSSIQLGVATKSDKATQTKKTTWAANKLCHRATQPIPTKITQQKSDQPTQEISQKSAAPAPPGHSFSTCAYLSKTARRCSLMPPESVEAKVQRSRTSFSTWVLLMCI